MKRHKVNRLFFDFEKEEKWINEMSTKGMHFIDYSFARYLFEEGTSGEYIYRIELLKNSPDHPESYAYIKFMEDSGIEYVAKWFNWVYFRKKSADGPFNLYSDYSSKILHYKRISLFVTIAIYGNLLAGFFNLGIGILLKFQNQSDFNAYISVINFTGALLFIPMFLSYSKTIKRLKTESKVFE